MTAETQRRSWYFPIFTSILVFGIICIAQISGQHWTENLGKNQISSHFGLLAPSHIPPRHGRREIPRTAIIDPVLAYSTFLGGTNFAGPGGTLQQAYASFVDGAGDVYVTGPTNAPDFPVSPGVVQTTNPSQAEISFLTKINPSGTSLIFSTYLNLLVSPVLAVDPFGNIFVGGYNPSFPIPSGTTPFQSMPHGILIVKLNSTATTVLNATFLGGSGQDNLAGLAVDAAGSVYAAGSTTSNDFPITKNAFQPSLGISGNSAFVTKLDSSLSNLVYSTYLGQDSSGGPIAVDASKNAYTIGQVGLTAGFPTTSGAVQASCASGALCSTLAKFGPTGFLTYATYLGGNTLGTRATAVAVDSAQSVFISGGTSFGFPQLNPLQPCVQNSADGFVAKITAAGALAFSTCLGTNVSALALDSSGIAYVAGSGAATLPPLVSPIEAIANPPQSAQFVAALDATAGKLLFSSFVSGIQSASATFATVGVDANKNIFAAGIGGGVVNGIPFPTFNAFQPSPSPAQFCSRAICGASDAIIVKISPTNGAAAALTPASVKFAAQQVGTTSAAQAVTVLDMGSATLTVSNATVTGDFSIQNGCTSVAAAGGTCAIQVTFTPTAVGTRTGTLTISDSSPGSPRIVQLTGQGAQPAATPSPSSLSFQNQPVGTTSSPQQVTLTSVGAVPLQILHLQTTGPFSETNACGNTLNPQQSCLISVSFTPTTIGISTGTLTITDDAADSPQTVPLTGNTGANSLGLAVPPGGSSSATITAGTSASYTLSIGGSGISGTASLTCTGAPSGAVCSLPSTVSVSAATASTFNVSVSTTHAQSIPQSVPSPGRFSPAPWLWALAMIGYLFLLRAAAPQRARRLAFRLAPLLGLALCSCGSGSSSTPTSNPTLTQMGTQAGTYTLVVTAQSGSTTQSQNLTLNVR